MAALPFIYLFVIYFIVQYAAQNIKTGSLEARA
jgi:hypothetical protein